MSNNQRDGHLGHLAIAEQLEQVNHHLDRLATAQERTAAAQERTADALERKNEIYITQHALSADLYEAVQRGEHDDN